MSLFNLRDQGTRIVSTSISAFAINFNATFRNSFRLLEIPFDFSTKRGEEATRIFFLEAIIKNICKIDEEVDDGKLKIDVYDIYEERNRSSFIERGDKKKIARRRFDLGQSKGFSVLLGYSEAFNQSRCFSFPLCSPGEINFPTFLVPPPPLPGPFLFSVGLT